MSYLSAVPRRFLPDDGGNLRLRRVAAVLVAIACAAAVYDGAAAAATSKPRPSPESLWRTFPLDPRPATRGSPPPPPRAGPSTRRAGDVMRRPVPSGGQVGAPKQSGQPRRRAAEHLPSTGTSLGSSTLFGAIALAGAVVLAAAAGVLIMRRRARRDSHHVNRWGTVVEGVVDRAAGVRLAVADRVNQLRLGVADRARDFADGTAYR